MQKKWMSVCLASALFLGGCSGSPAPEQPVPAAEPAVSLEEEQSYDFIFVCPILDNEYWAECIRGIKKADEELQITTQVTGPQDAENFAEEIVGHMEKAVEAEPDGIMAYAGIEALSPLIGQADEKGIPVLAIDSDAPDTARIAYVGTDLYAFGYQAGEALVKLTGGTARVGYICSTYSAQSEKKVFEAFQDAVDDYDIEIAASAEGKADPDYAAAAAEAMLAEHPEIDAIFCTAGYNITGAAVAKQKLGRTDLKLVGFDDVEENLKFVREGVIDVLLVQSPYQMGYQGVYLLKEYIDKGSLGREAYDTGSTLVTKENVDSFRE